MQEEDLERKLVTTLGPTCPKCESVMEEIRIVTNKVQKDARKCRFCGYREVL